LPAGNWGWSDIADVMFRRNITYLIPSFAGANGSKNIKKNYKPKKTFLEIPYKEELKKLMTPKFQNFKKEQLLVL
jgi:hypothetical protein